jgi:heme oxygenase
MTLLERLRTDTRSQHEQTEHLLYTEPLRTGTLSVQNYYHLLVTHLAYHRALEQAIDQHPDFFQDYVPDARRKTPWLMADLGSVATDLPSLTDVFANWTPIQLLGAAYVGEGSMLGGKTVWHYLQQSPALVSLLPAARFYRGYGPDTGQNWKAFGAFITEKGCGHEDEVVDAAGRAFTLYQELFQQTQPALPIEIASAN